MLVSIQEHLTGQAMICVLLWDVGTDGALICVK